MALTTSALCAKITAKLESAANELKTALSTRLDEFIRENFSKNANNIDILTLWQLDQRQDEWLTPVIDEYQNNSTAMDDQHAEIYQTITTPHLGKVEIITKFAHNIISNVKAALAEELVHRAQQYEKRQLTPGFFDHKNRIVSSNAGQEEFPVEQSAMHNSKFGA